MSSINTCPKCNNQYPDGTDHQCPYPCDTCKITRERDRYWRALQEITEVVQDTPGTRGMPTILAIIKKAATPEIGV